MNIVFLDAKTIGEDIDLSGYDKLGTVIKYGFSTTEEARERTKDADVVIVNKDHSRLPHFRRGHRQGHRPDDELRR